ncbi:hypothetical protein, partial [Galactobacter caseinivorans]|uniref:hypothetical protein n=1 Tax=Galactobacter caseinivorans TaxID=2676123 RepID=UPI0018F440A6
VALAQLDPLDPLAILNDGGYSLNTLQGTLLAKLALALSLAIPALLAWLIPRPLRALPYAARDHIVGGERSTNADDASRGILRLVIVGAAAWIIPSVVLAAGIDLRDIWSEMQDLWMLLLLAGLMAAPLAAISCLGTGFATLGVLWPILCRAGMRTWTAGLAAASLCQLGPVVRHTWALLTLPSEATDPSQRADLGGQVSLATGSLWLILFIVLISAALSRLATERGIIYRTLLGSIPLAGFSPHYWLWEILLQSRGIDFPFLLPITGASTIVVIAIILMAARRNTAAEGRDCSLERRDPHLRADS